MKRVDGEEPMIYVCSWLKLFKPLSLAECNSFLSDLGSGLNPSDLDVFICYSDEKEEEIHFYCVKNKYDSIVLLCTTHSKNSDKIPEITLNSSTLSMECVFADANESDVSVQFFNIHQKWEVKAMGESGTSTLPWLQQPPYNASSFIEVRCNPAEPANLFYSAYCNLVSLETDYPNDNEVSYRSYLNKTQALLHSDDVVTSVPADGDKEKSDEITSTGHVIEQRKNYDFTEKLYELVHRLPKLHQKACLEVVFDFLKFNQNVILDISLDNDTKLAALVGVRKKLSTTDFSDRLRTMCLSVDWVQDLVKDLGTYKIKRDYVYYFKRYHLDLPRTVIDGITSYNSLEKLHYLLELVKSISNTLELSEQELGLLSKLLLHAVQQSNFNLTNPPIFRVFIPLSLRAEVYAATRSLMMSKWSCYAPDIATEVYDLTSHGVFSARVSSTDTWSGPDENTPQWAVTKSTIRELPNFLKLLACQFDIPYIP